jgi:hypothetical protein
VVIAPTPYRTGFAGPTTNGQRGSNVHDLFSVRKRDIVVDVPISM